jgi:hypothetical protein
LTDRGANARILLVLGLGRELIGFDYFTVFVFDNYLY